MNDEASISRAEAKDTFTGEVVVMGNRIPAVESIVAFDSNDEFDAQLAEWRAEFESESPVNKTATVAKPVMSNAEWTQKLKAGRQEMVGKCKEVALRNTPSYLHVITRNSLTTSHDSATRTVYVPSPVTRRALFAYLIEVGLACGHSKWGARNRASQQIRSAGIAVPRRRRKLMPNNTYVYVV